MDPMTVIIGALAASVAKVASDAVQTGYSRLKRVILERYGGEDDSLEGAIEEYGDDPGASAAPLETALRKVHADRDQHVVDLATALLKTAEKEQPDVTGGLVGQINNQGGKVVVAKYVENLNM
jgi:hypothetical protein